MLTDWCSVVEELAVVAVAFLLEVIERDEAQRRGVDAVAHAALGGRAVGEHVAEVAVAVGRTDLGPVIPQLRSECSTTLALSIGTVKLGQPEPLSYLLTEANRGSPDTMST